MAVTESELERILSDIGPADARELLPFAVPALLRVLSKGLSHQGEWKRLSPADHREHAANHFMQHRQGNLIDDDGEPHVWHGICRLVMAAQRETLPQTGVLCELHNGGDPDNI